MFDFIESYFEAVETLSAELDYIYNHTDKIDYDFSTVQDALGVIQEKLAEISAQLGNISTWLYILAGLGALLLVLQIVILVKIMKKSNTTTNRKQLPAPKGEADGEVNE